MDNATATMGPPMCRRYALTSWPCVPPRLMAVWALNVTKPTTILVVIASSSDLNVKDQNLIRLTPKKPIARMSRYKVMTIDPRPRASVNNAFESQAPKPPPMFSVEPGFAAICSIDIDVAAL